MGVCDCAGEGDVKYVRYYQLYVMVYCSIYSSVVLPPQRVTRPAAGIGSALRRRRFCFLRLLFSESNCFYKRCLCYLTLLL